MENILKILMFSTFICFRPKLHLIKTKTWLMNKFENLLRHPIKQNARIYCIFVNTNVNLVILVKTAIQKNGLVNNHSIIAKNFPFQFFAILRWKIEKVTIRKNSVISFNTWNIPKLILNMIFGIFYFSTFSNMKISGKIRKIIIRANFRIFSNSVKMKNSRDSTYFCTLKNCGGVFWRFIF